MSIRLNLCMLFICLSLLACRQEQHKAELKPQIRPVKTMRIDRVYKKQVKIFSGIARPAVETALSFRVSGVVEKIFVKVGSHVQKGNLVARLDSTDYELQVKRRQAQVAQAEAQYQEASFDYERIKSLYEVENVSKRELDQARAKYKSAKAELEASEKALELAEQKLKYCFLKAPLEGEIVNIPVEVHQTVATGQPVVLLASISEMEMEIGVPESLIGKIKVGQKTQVSFDVLGKREFLAEVSEVGVETGPTTTYPVTLSILGEHSEIKPGMVGQVRFELKNFKKGYFVVPPQAVVGVGEEQGQVWVYSFDNSKVYKRKVKTGLLTPEGLQVLDGLNIGERIVIRGVNRLEQGMKVRLMEEG